MINILAIIPARGGSKGIPRKNVRLLNGKPLIWYAINNAKNSKYNIDVYVSSDDEEIISLSKKFGAKIHKRSKELSRDDVTLDPVIYDALKYAEDKENKKYDLIITLQPTSPLLKSSSLDKAIEKMLNSDIDTILSVKDSTHLSWRKEGGKYLPNFTKRVNRQYLTPTFTETGGFLITKRDVISEDNRIRKNVDLYVLKNGEEIDIDTYEDWNLCEYYLKRKTLLLVVRGNREIGLGHVYNMLALANGILNHRIIFLVLNDSELAYEKISSYFYEVHFQKEDILKEIEKINPDVVINDILDTDKDYIKELKKRGCKVINFEDLGSGGMEADIVINAIYKEKEPLKNHYFGAKYYILRDEFIYTPIKKIGDKVKRVVVSFGGVDPNNFTRKVIESIYDYCITESIEIDVIAGMGYDKYDSLKEFEKINIYKDVRNISDYFYNADIIFTSAGRTIYEVASIGVPAIVLAQNKRELSHFFASSENGFINLGLGINVSNEEILEEFKRVVEDKELRENMNRLMLKNDVKSGRERVIKLIKDFVEEEK